MGDLMMNRLLLIEQSIFFFFFLVFEFCSADYRKTLKAS